MTDFRLQDGAELLGEELRPASDVVDSEGWQDFALRESPQAPTLQERPQTLTLQESPQEHVLRASRPWWRLPWGLGIVGRELLVAVPLYVVLALIFTFPLVLHFNTYLIGDLESDIWKHVWGMWWVKVCMQDQGVLPLSTNLLNAPYGGALFFIDPLNALISLPLQQIWDMRIVYNLMVLFNLVLAASGAYGLCRYLCHNRYAAFVGGTIYAFSAYMMAYINSGVTEAINIGWMPLFTLFFIRMLERNSWADAVRASVFFACATLGSWYYGAFCVLVGTFYYAYFTLHLYRRPLREWLADMWERVRRPWAPLAQAGVGLLVALALYTHYLHYNLTPFQSTGLSWCMAFWSLVGVLWLGAGVRQPRLVGLYISRWLMVLPLALLFGWEINGLLALWGWDYWSCPTVWIVIVEVGLGAWLWLRWRWRQAEAEVWQRYWGAEAALAVQLLGYGCLAVVVYFALFLVLAHSPGGDDWPRLGLCAGSLVLWVLGFKALLKRWPCDGLQQAVWGAYLACLRDYAWLWLVASIVAIPWWRHQYPEAELAPFAFVYFSAAVVAIVLVTVAVHLARLGVKRLRQQGEEQSVWRLLGRNLGQWYRLGGGRRFVQRLVVTPLLFSVLAGMLIAAPTSAFNRTINAEGSMVFRKRVANSIDIHLSRSFRNISNLSDYFCGGKERTNRTYTVDKLTRVSYAGWVALILAALALRTRRRQRYFWAAMVLVFMMFSLGPYLYVNEDIYSSKPSFIYMAFFNYFPAFAQIAIPYRFVTVVMMSLAVLSSLSLSVLLRHWERRQAVLLVVGLCGAVLFEMAVFSSAPYPIPLSQSAMPAYCADIARDPDDVGLIDYPIQRYKGELLPGEYFYYQIAHGKDLPNRVEGTIPLFVYQNGFTNYLFVLEHAQSDIPPRSQGELRRGLQELARFRFRYLVVHDNLLRASARERLHKLMRFYLGEPRRYPQGVSVYRIPSPQELRARYGAEFASGAAGTDSGENDAVSGAAGADSGEDDAVSGAAGADSGEDDAASGAKGAVAGEEGATLGVDAVVSDGDGAVPGEDGEL